MRKRMNYLAVMAAAALLALTACNEEAALTLPAEPQNPPVADNSGNVYITGDDFTWELGGGSEGDEGGASSIHAVTRSQLIVDGNTARFAWTPGDRVGILPDQGAQVWFEIPTPEEGEEPTNVAAFDGGAWALKPTSDYAAYYPFVKDFDLDRTKVPVSYTGQAQTGNGTTAHLGAYDYQGARPSTTNGAGGVSFDFDHVGALVLLQFTVPTGGTQLTGVTLSADGAAFTTAGTYDLTSTEGFPITPTETAESMTIGLNYTTTADGETVTLYFLCAPIDLSGKTVNVSVACSGTEGETIEFEADGKNLVAAGGYLLKKKEIPYLTFSADAEQTLKLALEDWDNVGLQVNFEYSVNGAEWSLATVGESIAFGGTAGDLRLRAKSQFGTAYKDDYKACFYQISFGNDTPVECTGDIRTLVDWENYATVSTEMARFCRLFEGCTALTTAPELPATTLAAYCYEG
ncbi:MAG: fimbrillin family protein, partial [Muribaculaceae bacterium]|nr:fimbrillin family protein [Muribaculaceae bacterium]